MRQDLTQSGMEGLELQIGYDLLNLRTNKPVVHIVATSEYRNSNSTLFTVRYVVTPVL